MATRDVELIVKARNEASAALEKVSSALADLQKHQTETASGATKLGAAHEKLNADLKALANQQAVLKALESVAAHLERAEKAAERTQAIIPKLRAEEAALAAEANKAAEAHAVMANRLTASKAAFDGEAASLSKAKADLKEYTAAAKTAAAQKRELEKATFYRDPATNRFASLSAAREKAAADHAEALRQIDAQKAAIGQLTAAKKAASDAAKLASADEIAAARTASATASALASKTRSREFAEAKSAQATGALNEMRAAGQAAAAVLGNVALKQDALAAASARSAAILKQTAAALEAERAAALRAEPQARTGRRTLADYQAERVGLASAGDALTEARANAAMRRADATRLGRELAGAAVPTADMVAEFNLAKRAADEATQAYYRQAEAVRRLHEAERARLADARARVERDRSITDARASGAPMFTPLSSQWQAAAPGPQQDSHVLAQRRYNEEVKRTVENGEKLRASFANVREAVTGNNSALGQSVSGVLALAAAYVGLHAAAQQLHQVVEVIRIMDAAQNRLGVVFEGNVARTAQEIAFLQAQSERLGISFGTMLDQYARVSLAAKEVGASTEQTRKIFMAFSETGRVAKLSNNEMQRMFLAIDEMMSRGKIQAKELRQLSYTIAGAPEIIAKSLGLTMAQLTEKMKGGEVEASVENLLKISDGLTSRYGAQLPEALKTTTTEIGRLSNTTFRLREAFAEGGFSEGLRIALHAVNEELSKPEARAGMRELGAAAGRAVQMIVPLVRHVGDLAAVLGVLAGAWAVLKVGTWVQSLAVASLAFVRFAAAIRTVGVAASAAGLLATGTNPIGLTLLAIAAAAGAAYYGYNKFVGGTKVAPDIDALARHREHLVELQRVYEDNGQSLDGWKEKIKNVDLSGLEKSFNEMQKMFQERSVEFNKMTLNPFAGRVMTGAAGLDKSETDKMVQLIDQLREGKMTVENFGRAVEEMQHHASSPEGARGLGALLGEVWKLAQAEDNFRKAATMAVEFGSANENARKAADKYGMTLKQIVAPHDAVAEAAEQAKKKAENYRQAMDALDETIKKATKGHTDLELVTDAVANKYKAIANAATDAKDAIEKGDRAIDASLRKYYGLKPGDDDKDKSALDALMSGGKMTREEAQKRIDAAKADVKAQKDAEEAKDKAEKTAAAQKSFDTQSEIDAGKHERTAQRENELNAAKRRLEESKKTGRGTEDAQRIVNALERDQAIQKAEDALRDKAAGKDGVVVSDAQIKRARDQAAAEFDAKHLNDEKDQQKERLQEAESRLSEFLSRKKALEEAISFGVEHPGSSSPEQQAQLRGELAAVKVQAGEAADEAERLARALGDRKAVDNIRNQRNSLRDMKDSFIDIKAVATNFANGLSGAIDKSADAIGKALSHTQKWSSAWKEVRNAFLNFAADFLKQTGQMLVRKALFNMLGLDDGGGKKGKAGVSGEGGLLGALTGGSGGGATPFSIMSGGKTTTGIAAIGSGGLTGDGVLGALGGAMGRNRAPVDPNALYAPQEGPQKAGGPLIDAINKSAGELGVNPRDLASAISYETGGTFNPNKWGGKNNNYMGLIQFGPNERAKYGVTEGMSASDQMESVTKYLRDRGVRKGMGLAEIYRAINGGNVKASLNASDGNGTIAEHIEKIKKQHGGAYDRLAKKEGATNVDTEPTGTIKSASEPLFKAPPMLEEPKIEDREARLAAERDKLAARNAVDANNADMNAPGADRVSPDLALAEARKEAARVAERDAPPVDDRELRIGMERQRKAAEDAKRMTDALTKDAPLPPPRPADLGESPSSTGSEAMGAGGGSLFGSMGSMLPFLGMGTSALMMLLARKKKKISPALQMAPMILSFLPKLFGAFGSFGIMHTGGIAGEGSGVMRSVHAGVFSDMVRMHSGGIAGGGLKPGEVPRILDKSEEVLTKNNPRHIANVGKGGPGAPQKVGVKVINTLDPGEFMSHGLDTAHGEQAILNFIRGNSDAIKGILG